MRQNMRPQLKSIFLGMLDKARYTHDAKTKLSDQHFIKLKANKNEGIYRDILKQITFKAITLRPEGYENEGLRNAFGWIWGPAPVNAYAPGMRRATRNGPAENKKNKAKQKQNKQKPKKTIACANRDIPKKVTVKAIICRLGID